MLASLDVQAPPTALNSNWDPTELNLLLQVLNFPLEGAIRGRGWDAVIGPRTLGAGATGFHKNGGGAGCGSVIYFRPAVGSTPSLAFALVLNKELNDHTQMDGFGPFASTWQSSEFCQSVETLVSELGQSLPMEDLFDPKYKLF